MINAIMSKLFEINLLLLTLIYLLGFIGVAMIYAATDGVWSHGAMQHLVRLILTGGLLICVALTDIKVWYSLAYPIYAFALLLLLGVDLVGVSVNGSQRWLDLGLFRLQPSELMKLALVLALARFYNDLEAQHVSHISGVAGALLLIALPVQFVLRQPDLGTTLLLASTGIAIVFLAGINRRIIVSALISMIVILPLFIRFGLKEYQRSRLLTFFDPGRDPTGAGYHITQSKIALGSGGFSGKGFMNGTQRQSGWVPENRTDFIFTVIGEEFGLLGGILTMSIYAALIALTTWLALQCKNLFSQLLILGTITTFTLYIFINLGMVTGLMPVVGVPLPLISYGGTVILTTMFGFGLVLSCQLHMKSELPRGGGR